MYVDEGKEFTKVLFWFNLITLSMENDSGNDDKAFTQYKRQWYEIRVLLILSAQEITLLWQQSVFNV